MSRESLGVSRREESNFRGEETYHFYAPCRNTRHEASTSIVCAITPDPLSSSHPQLSGHTLKYSRAHSVSTKVDLCQNIIDSEGPNPRVTSHAHECGGMCLGKRPYPARHIQPHKAISRSQQLSSATDRRGLRHLSIISMNSRMTTG